VHYTITVTNSGDATLVNVVVTDPMLGAELFRALPPPWHPGQFLLRLCLHGKADRPGPAGEHSHGTCQPPGLPNDITASATATVDLVHPLIKVTKTADNTVSKVGDTVRFTVRCRTPEMCP